MAAQSQILVEKEVTSTPGAATLTLVLEPQAVSREADAQQYPAPLAIGSPNGPGAKPPKRKSANLQVMQSPVSPEPNLARTHSAWIRFDTKVIVAAIPLLIPAFCVLSGVSILCCTIAEAWLVLGYILVFALILLDRKQITRRDFAGFWTAILRTFSRQASTTNR